MIAERTYFFFFSRKAFHVKCILCSCRHQVFTEHLLCASLAKELPCSQRAQNSEFVFWELLWLKYRYSGRQKQRRLTQGKLPQRSKSKVRSVRWIGLANEDCELCESRGLSVCALRYKCWMKEWMNEWINQWSSSNTWKRVEERKHSMCKPQSSAWLENRALMGKMGDEHDRWKRRL